MAVQVPTNIATPDAQLIESDGEPLDSFWHVLQIGLLLEMLAYAFRDRNDYFAGGNMFIDYSEEQARNRDYRGPDFFYVDGVNRLPMRPYWAVWQEGGRYPDFIIELLSPTTAVEDRTTKRTLYERTFKTHEYVCYDPEARQVEGWRLGSRRRYRGLKPDERGWLWMESVELWLGTWQGTYRGYEDTWLRFYDKEGTLLRTGEEAAVAASNAAQAAEAAAVAAAEAAAAEVARLKARIAELESGQGHGPGEQAQDGR
jgi:Uma2 family endonuclease